MENVRPANTFGTIIIGTMVTAGNVVCTVAAIAAVPWKIVAGVLVRVKKEGESLVAGMSRLVAGHGAPGTVSMQQQAAKAAEFGLLWLLWLR